MRLEGKYVRGGAQSLVGRDDNGGCSQHSQAVHSPALLTPGEKTRDVRVAFQATRQFSNREDFSSLLKGRFSSSPRAVW